MSPLQVMWNKAQSLGVARRAAERKLAMLRASPSDLARFRPETTGLPALPHSGGGSERPSGLEMAITFQSPGTDQRRLSLEHPRGSP